jgi:cell division septation protein DedD
MPRLTTRDYKRPSRGASAARLKEFGLGVLVGAALASAAFLFAGAQARRGAGVDARHHVVGDSRSHAPLAPAPDEGSAGAASEAGRGDSAPTPKPASAKAPQYDFYKMLPRFQVPVPHDDQRSSHAAPPAVAAGAGTAVGEPRPDTSAPSYVLQVGSYRSSAEADHVRARLAKVGLSAQVQRVVEGSTTWNRVRIGPLTDPELARVREQLRTANIHALVIRADR